PLGPRRTTISPAAISSETPRRAAVEPYDLCTSVMVRMGGVMVLSRLRANDLQIVLQPPSYSILMESLTLAIMGEMRPAAAVSAGGILSFTPLQLTGAMVRKFERLRTLEQVQRLDPV